jgi:hypothetical protein
MLRVQKLIPAAIDQRSERRMKDTDHRVVHLVVHLANHRSMKEKKSLEIVTRAVWARLGNGLGWSDPIVRRAHAPNRLRGVAPAQAETLSAQ